MRNFIKIFSRNFNRNCFINFCRNFYENSTKSIFIFRPRNSLWEYNRIEFLKSFSANFANSFSKRCSNFPRNFSPQDFFYEISQKNARNFSGNLADFSVILSGMPRGIFSIILIRNSLRKFRQNFKQYFFQEISPRTPPVIFPGILPKFCLAKFLKKSLESSGIYFKRLCEILWEIP